MLKSVRIENSLSFRDGFEFTLERPARNINAISDSDAHEGWNARIGTIGAVFGANASGKTAFVKSLKALVSNVIGERVRSSPFLLEEASSKNISEYAIEFSAETLTGFSTSPEKAFSDYFYEYGVLEGTVVFERLYTKAHQARKKWRKVFEREKDIGRLGGYRYEWGAVSRHDMGIVKKLTRNDMLFLHASANLQDNPLEPVANWFFKSVQFASDNSYENELTFIAQGLRRNEEGLKDFLRFGLQAADVGVDDLSFIEPDRHEIDQVATSLSSLLDGFKAEDMDNLRDMLTERKREIQFMHRSKDGPVALRQEDESKGTLAMLAFWGIANRVLHLGATLIIDELDTSLHPLLVRKIVEVFASPTTNPNQAQLVFTTHDLTLLIDEPAFPRILDRDQIWIVDKARDGSSTLSVLTDFGIRAEANFFRRYLQGGFGGVPNVGDLQ